MGIDGNYRRNPFGTLVQLLVFDNTHPRLTARARRVLERLPAIGGLAINVGFVEDLSAHGHGPIHAGSLLRERRILFETSLRGDSSEFARIFVHELFHFAWLRLGNARRRSWEDLLLAEIAAHARGELGWSAEWRKNALGADDRRLRTRRWREYACESFCDTAAWLYSGIGRHAEFNLSARFLAGRRQWFRKFAATGRISL
jgi:hypothetical protein